MQKENFRLQDSSPPPQVPFCIREHISLLWSLIRQWQLWLVYAPEMPFYLFRDVIICYCLPWAQAVSSAELCCSERTIKRPALACQVWSHFFIFLTLLIIKVFPFYYVSLFSHLLSLWEICMPLFLGKKVMTAISFLFSPSLAVWVLRLVAPAKATAAKMRSEREQLIKSSSSRSTESQFCLPSTMISFYLKVMSYGTFASGNTMSSISMFHLLHKQGQVIPAGFYLAIKAIGCTARRRGEGGRAKGKKGGLHVFLFITSQWKTEIVSSIQTFCFLLLHLHVEKRLMSASSLCWCHILRRLDWWCICKRGGRCDVWPE